MEPEEGVSAIQIAAAAVAAMPLGRIDERTTANVGRIEGGVAVNIVPAVVTLMGECRSLYEDRVLAQRDAMTRALEEAAARFGPGEMAWELDYPAVVLEPGDAIAAHLEAAAATCGLESRHATSGGGADANILGTKGADAITLGIGMTNFHSVDEYIDVADLQNMARYVETIIAEYAGALGRSRGGATTLIASLRPSGRESLVPAPAGTKARIFECGYQTACFARRREPNRPSWLK